MIRSVLSGFCLTMALLFALFNELSTAKVFVVLGFALALWVLFFPMRTEHPTRRLR